MKNSLNEMTTERLGLKFDVERNGGAEWLWASDLIVSIHLGGAFQVMPYLISFIEQLGLGGCSTNPQPNHSGSII